MKWIILLAAVCGFAWAANWSYHLLDDAFLITSAVPTEDVKKWGLINFQDGTSQLYNFTSAVGFWAIFKALWPISTLFILIFLLLIPVSVYISNSLTKLQIINADKAQKIAEKHAIDTVKEANIRVANAVTEATKNANDALALQTQKLQEREATIDAREQSALATEQAAQKKVEEVIWQYKQELARFEAEISKMQTSKNHAQQAFKRIKEQRDRNSLSKI